MKPDIKIIIKTLVLSVGMIFLFSLALLGGSHLLSISSGAAKEFTPSHILDDNVFLKTHDSPVSQALLQEKFEIYNHIDFIETSQENSQIQLTLFSKEQAETLYAQKKHNEGASLSYDEILFLINDSIRLYHGYDRIILTNSNLYGITSDLSSSDHLDIHCYHGDYSELGYKDAKEKEAQKIEDINSIIRYRLCMLHSSYSRETIKSTAFSGRNGFEQELLISEEIANIADTDDDFIYYSECYLLLVDHNNTLGEQTLYEDKIKEEFLLAFGVCEPYVAPETHFDLEYPLVFLNISNSFMPDIVLCYGDTRMEYSIENLLE